MNLDRRLLRLTRSVRLWLGLTILLGVLGGILVVLQAGLLSGTIDRVFLGGASLADVTPLLLALAGIAGLRALTTWGGTVTGQQVAGRIKQELRERLFAHLLALGPAYTQAERSGELAHSLLEGVEALDAYFSQYLPQIALAALVPITYLIVVFPADPLSGVVLLVTAPLIPFFMILIGKAAEILTRRQWGVLSRMSAHFLDVLQGLTTLKLLGRSRKQIEVIGRISDSWRRTTLGVLRVAFLSALVLEMLATISTAVVAVEIGIRLLYGGLDFQRALFVLILAPEYYLPLRTLGTRFHAGMSGVAAAQRIFGILETGEAQLNRQDARSAKEKQRKNTSMPLVSPSPFTERGPGGEVLPSRFDLVFEGVTYAYADGQRAALDGVSFTISTGEQIALVGPSGAGKSTIAALLLGFIAPQGGMITVGGVPLDTLDADAWRARVAWVPQRPYLFNASLIDNVRLGRPEATPDEVAWAARQAHADAFIRALPEGYATVIGERGARLSGGQAQRIALARAFLKDAPFLILDEATANLDAENEALVQAAIERLLERRSALVIAHRLRTVARADRILVLEGGRVVEAGPHADLVAAGGLYSRLFAAYAGAGGS